MKHILSSLILSGFCLSSTAQKADFSVKTGEYHKIKKAGFSAFTGSNEQFFYTFGGKRTQTQYRETKNPYYVKKYNMETFELEEEWKVEDWKFQKRKPSFIREVHTGKKVHLLFECYDKRKDRHYILARTLENNTSLSPYKVLVDLPSEDDELYSFELKVSSDSSKIGIVAYSNPEVEMKEPEVAVFNEDLDLVWKQTGLYPYEGQTFFVKDHSFSNEGSLYAIGYAGSRKELKTYYRNKYTTTKIFYEEGIHPSVQKDYLLTKVTPGGAIEQYNLKSLDKYFHSVTLHTDVKGRLLLSGFYSDQRSEFPLGYFILSMDPFNLKILSSTFKELDKGTESEAKAREVSSSNKLAKGIMVRSGFALIPEGLKAYGFKDLIIKEDSTICLIAEKQLFEQGVGNSLEIFVVNLDENFNPVWTAKIPKQQRMGLKSGYTPYLSYIPIEKNAHLYFVYNDHEDNLENYFNGEKPQTWQRITKTEIYIASVDPKGKTDYRILEYEKERTEAVLVDKSHITKDKDVMFSVHSPWNYYKIRFAKVKFPDQ